MPIFEFYCPDNNRIYQFYARNLAQGRTVPPCPDHPKFRMQKALSAFAVGGRAKEGGEGAAGAPPDRPGDARLEAAMGAMEREFSSVDENDPKAMGRMMRRMAEMTGEKMGGDMEEVMRKLEEGADPASLEEQLGADTGDDTGDPPAGVARRRPGTRRSAPTRDPKLYEYP
jgi:hypothetical protein